MMRTKALFCVLFAAIPLSTCDQATDGLQQALTQLKQGEKAFLDDALEFLAFPSVSALPHNLPALVACAGWLERRLQRAGLEHVQILNTTGPRPVVYADWLHAEGAPTALIYAHYDVQPADPESEWTSPPFEPAVRDGRIYARGADDDKGNLLLPVQAVSAILAANKALPINVKFLLEGEEEVGSPFLEPFLQEHRDLLEADFVLSADGGQLGEAQPGLVLGMRGAVAVELAVTSLSVDTHSGMAGGAVQNPIRALSQLLASMHFPNGSVAVAGFYDDVKPVSQEDRDDILSYNFDEEVELHQRLGAEPCGEEGYTSLERLWHRPTVEFTGIAGGFAGEGIKTVIPRSARAKVAARLVPNQHPDTILRLLEEHVAANHPPACNVTIKVLGFRSHPYSMPRDTPVNKAAAKVLTHLMGNSPKFVRGGATIPALAYIQQTLGLDTTLFAFGIPGSNVHAPDEFFPLNMYALGREAYVHLLYELAEVPRAGSSSWTEYSKDEL